MAFIIYNLYILYFHTNLLEKVIFVLDTSKSVIKRLLCSWMSLQLALLHKSFLGTYPAGTWRKYNVASTSMQRHDVASTLRRCYIYVMCLLGIGTENAKIRQPIRIFNVPESACLTSNLLNLHILAATSENVSYSIAPVQSHLSICYPPKENLASLTSHRMPNKDTDQTIQCTSWSVSLLGTDVMVRSYLQIGWVSR